MKKRREFNSGGHTAPKIHRGAASHFGARGRPKVSYLSEGGAVEAMNRQPFQSNRNVYRCGQCGGWHIGGAA
jgi:hypothetical protein